MSSPKVSVIIPNWNGKDVLKDCLGSLAKQTYPNYEVVLVDNASLDDSVSYTRKNFPQVKVVCCEENLGFARGCNVGIKSCSGELVALLNNDTLVEPTWLERLVEKIESNDTVGACMSKILLFDKKDTINSSGGVVHYLGFAWAGEHGIKDKNSSGEREVAVASGAASLYKREVLNEVGLFDETYFMYHEDVDLTWRLRLAGYKAVYVPTSVVFHKYEFSKGGYKFYHIEKNRLSLILTHYGFRTIFLILPVLILTELGLLFYFLLQRTLLDKLKGYSYIVRNYHLVTESRRRVQALRKVKDREITKLFSPTIDAWEIRNPVLTYVVNPILASYWWVAKRLV